MPLNDESCAVVVIWSRMLLYCDTRLARTNCPGGSASGAAAVRPLKGLLAPAAVPPMVPIVDDAASLVVVMVMPPVESSVACRLLAASLVFRSLRLLTVPPVPLPKVMLVAVPLPVAPIVRVRPLRACVPPARAGGAADRQSLVKAAVVPPRMRSCG